MRGGESIDHIDGPAHRLVDADGFAGRNLVLQGAAIDQLHRDRGRALNTMRTQHEHAARVADAGSQTRLAPEATEGLIREGQVFGEDLERNLAPGGELDGLVHHAHASAAELALQAEAITFSRERGQCVGRGGHS